MPYKFDDACRDKFDKARYRVVNASEYIESLRQPGDLTVWVSDDVAKFWTPPRRRNRGGQAVYSDPAIEICLTLRAVFLTRMDDGCWGYKDIEESAGPCESHAPLSILNLLSELKDLDSYAHAWRQRCRDWAAIPDYSEGDKIKLVAPVTLSDGSTCQIVTATHYRRGRQQRRCYRIEETGSLVRLSKASLAGSELISREKGEGSAVLAEFFCGAKRLVTSELSCPLQNNKIICIS